MSPEEYEDAKLAASMANDTRSYFKQKFSGNDPRVLANMLPDPTIQIDPKKLLNRDWRQYAHEVVNQPAPQPYNYGPPNTNQPVEIKPLLPVPVGRDEHGNIIMGNPQEIIQQTVPIQQTGLQTVGFQLPQFGNNGLKTEEESESKYDIILKELKSLRKAINKLIRVQEQSKVAIQPQQKDEIEDFNQS
jgi:hypothetical protein